MKTPIGRASILLVVSGLWLAAQTTINGGRVISGNWDAGNAASTRPVRTGTGLPANCNVGEQFFRTDAAAGQNLYFCTAANIWTQMPAGGAGAPSGPAAGDLSESYPNPTVAKINGTSVPTNSAANQTLVTTASATSSWVALADCVSNGGVLQYATSTHTFSCHSLASADMPPSVVQGAPSLTTPGAIPKVSPAGTLAESAISDDGADTVTVTGRSVAVGTTLPAGAPIGTIGASVIYSPNGALNVMGFGASGSTTATTTVGTTTAPATSVTLTSATTYAKGQGITIAGAGPAGALYLGTISNVAGAVLTITPATSTTVAGGAAVNHDDLAAIHAAIAALPTNGGGVYFPPGTYNHATPVLLHRGNVELVGAGIGASTVYNAGTGVGIDVAGGSTYNNVIRDISVIGNAASSHGLVADSATEIILNNAEFSNNGGYGLYFTNSFSARILHCIILNNVLGGVYEGAGSNGNVIRDSRIAGNGTFGGIQAQSFSDLVIVGNVLESQYYGVTAVGGSALTFDGNYCESNSQFCIELGSGAYLHGGSVRNNYINCSGAIYGISAYLNVTGVQISGNYFVGCTVADIIFYAGTSTNYGNIVGPNSFATTPVVTGKFLGNFVMSPDGRISAAPGGAVAACHNYTLACTSGACTSDGTPVTITGASPFRFTIQTGVLPAGALVTWASVDHASTWTTVAGTITGLTLSVGATTGTQDTYYTASQNLFAATGNTEGSGFPKRPNGTGADLVKGVLVGTFSSGNFTGQDLTGTANIHVCWVQP